MRDAFGGVFMIRLLLVFIVIYVAFTAISLNYAKSFRVKNKVISFIEENDITNMDSLFNSIDESKLTELDSILSSSHYNVTCAKEGILDRQDELSPRRYCYHGVVIEETPATNNIIYYEISTYVNWNLNFMNRILMLAGREPSDADVINGTWRITGEAKVVKRT